MKALTTLSPILFLLVAGCPAPTARPDDAGGQCSALDAGCSEGLACCSGGSCVGGQCACVAVEGAACGGANPVCCAGLSCDATGHCQVPCPGASGACHAPNDVCTTSASCCAPATCVHGTCQLMPPRCVEDGEACSTDSDCCGDPALGTRPACVTRGSGRICHFGRRDEACTASQRCVPALQCVVDAGVPVDAGSPTDAGSGTDGGSPGDGGLPDAGAVIDAGLPVDAGVQVGVCGVAGNPPSCSLRSATSSCGLGASCNPGAATNQGYDPCGLRFDGSSLVYRSPSLICHSGACSLPQLFEACDSKCGLTAGVAHRPGCVQLDTYSQICLESCTTDADCPGTFFPSGDLTRTMQAGLISPVPLTMWCVPHPELGKSFCQPRLCYEDAPDRDNRGMLYKPCADAPNSLCIPHESMGLSDYFGSSSTSTVLGFCQAVRPGGAPTVGEACDVRAGTETGSALCGPDATCVGGICHRTCDASRPGPDFPECLPTETCLNPYLGTDPVAGNQAGVCGVACDPFADEAHSGCTSWCGGPRARCQWQGLDRAPATAHCETAAANPKGAGQPCTASMECQSGLQCWSTADDGSDPTCTQLCSLAAPAGSPDACRQGSCQPFYDKAKKVGVCL